MKFKLLVILVLLTGYASLLFVAASRADEKPAAAAVAPIAIPVAERQAVIDAYKAVVDANKDFQIALLKARVKCKVDETWQIDLQTMSFMPPAPAKAEPTKP
jgi:hypothetical protein